MKATYLKEYGDNPLTIDTEAPKPDPVPEEVIVKVHAAGVNPFDYKIKSGVYKDYFEVSLPAILGGDVSGIVESVGSNVTTFKAGDVVYGMANAASSHGSFAEYTPVKQAQLHAKPQSITFTESAALPLVAISAYQALVDHMHLQVGQKILIHGGAGGIGSVAIQIAKHLGAHVATTISGGDGAFVKELGADEIIDYKTQDFAEIISDYDAVFDTIGGETTEKSYGVLKPGGQLVSMVTPSNEELVKKYNIDFTQESTQANPERLEAITKLVDEGVLKVNVDRVFTLDEASEALDYLRTGHPKGKVVIQVIAD